MVYTRDFNSFTDDEIVAIVDFIASRSQTVSAGGEMRYRKIEVMFHHSNLLFRISYAEEADIKKTVVAFIIDKIDDDLIINPVTNTIYEKFFIRNFLKLNEELVLKRGILETYRFFNEELEYWDTGKNVKLRLKPITSEWTVIETFNRANSKKQKII